MRRRGRGADVDFRQARALGRRLGILANSVTFGRPGSAVVAPAEFSRIPLRSAIGASRQVPNCLSVEGGQLTRVDLKRTILGMTPQPDDDLKSQADRKQPSTRKQSPTRRRSSTRKRLATREPLSTRDELLAR